MSTDHTRAVAFQHQHVVTSGNQQQLGEPSPQYDSGLAIGSATVFDPHLAVQPDSRSDATVDQPRQQPRLVTSGAVVGDHCRRDHGRDKWPRRHRAPEFFYHHHEFGQPVA